MGESLATLAKEVGVSTPSLSSFMKRMGVPIRNPGCAANKPLYLYGVGGERLYFRSNSEGARYFGVDRRTLLARIARGEIRQYAPRVFRAHPGIDCMPDALASWKIFNLLKNKKNMTKTKLFQKGLSLLRICDLERCRAELMAALGVETLQSLRMYARGERRLDVEVAGEIEQIFKRYGVDDPWGAAQKQEEE